MVKTKGIVLREIEYGETSKILNVYTDKIGRISILVRGAYNPKSKFIANTQIFSLNELQLRKGKNFYYIDEADLLDSFYGIRERIERVIFGYYMLELIDKSLPIEQENELIFNMLEKGLNILSRLDEGYFKFIIAYELKFVSFLGYRPYLDGCVSCRNSKANRMKFSIDKGGVICEDCFKTDRNSMYMNLDQYKLLVELLFSPLDQLDEVESVEDDLIRIHNILVKYILFNIDRKGFKSLELLEGLM